MIKPTYWCDLRGQQLKVRHWHDVAKTVTLEGVGLALGVAIDSTGHRVMGDFVTAVAVDSKDAHKYVCVRCVNVIKQHGKPHRWKPLAECSPRYLAQRRGHTCTSPRKK